MSILSCPVLTLIVKVTNDCNLDCSYCYAINQCDLAEVFPFIMTHKVLENITRQALNMNTPVVKFIWHGGEPLLSGLHFFEEALELQTRYRRPNQRVDNSIQTNGVLLNYEWVDFFKANNFSVGISIDGPDHIHNAQRTNNVGEPSFKAVLAGLNLLKENGVNFGVLAVVTKKSLDQAKEIFHFILGQGISSIDFLPCVEVDPNTGEITGLTPTPFELARFMIEMFDLWYEHDDPLFKVRSFENILVGLAGQTPSLCTFSGNCSQHFAITPYGDLYHCDWFIGQKNKCFGNIVNQGLAELIQNEQYSEYVAGVNRPKIECLQCRWRPICNGGCTYHRSIQGSFQSPYYFCLARKIMFNHMNGRFQATARSLGVTDLPEWSTS